MRFGYWYEVLSDEPGTLVDVDDKALRRLCDETACDRLNFAGDSQPALKQLIERMKEGDQLVVPSLSRFAQSTADLIAVMEKMFEKKVAFQALDWPEGELYEGGATLCIMKRVAAFQRAMFAAAAQREAATIRLRGRSGGRPKIGNTELSRALKLYDQNKLSIENITKRTGVSKSTLYKYLTQRRREREDKK